MDTNTDFARIYETAVDAVTAGHTPTTRQVSGRGGQVTNVAACTCGIEHNWSTRGGDQAAHEREILARAVYDAAVIDGHSNGAGGLRAALEVVERDGFGANVDADQTIEGAARHLLAAFGEPTDGDWWGAHPAYPVSDWQAEVANEHTRAGYWAWITNHAESETE